MAVPARISIVTLGVADLARSIAFYEALGWQRSSASNEEISWFHTADSALGLFPWEHLAEDAHPWEVAHNPGFGLTEDGRLDLP